MKTVLILGATGMSGSVVGKSFQSLPSYDTYLTGRDLSLAYRTKANWIKYDPTSHDSNCAVTLQEILHQMPQNPDYVINCIGVIKPFIEKDRTHSVLLNSLLPHQLADACQALKIKIIHITTDCVFSGAKGSYNESSLHDCLDMYGKSKSLGEPTNCMVVRTSIIGPEIHKNASLIAWAQSQKGKEVKGFTNHLWNGMTTKQYAKVCHSIMEQNLFEHGTFHVFSNTVNKCELLHLINNRYKLDLKITPFEAAEACDRSMTTTKSLCSKLQMPSLESQINDL